MPSRTTPVHRPTTPRTRAELGSAERGVHTGMRELSLADLFAGVDPAPSWVGCDPSTRVRSVQTDSRNVEAGDAFVAIRGETHDGHAFLEVARARGASVLVVAADHPAPDGPHVVIANPNDALPTIAANAHGRPGDTLRLAGVTGTNGKTTTAHLVGAILRHAGVLHARLGTTGNWLVDHEDTAGFTTPFPLELQALLARARDHGATAAVMEVSSHALSQGRARPLRFDAVGLTSFSQDHLDFHATMEAYLDAKCRLAAEHLADRGLAIAAVDEQPAAARFLAAAAGRRTWRASRGADPRAEIRATDLVEDTGGMRATLHTPAGTIAVRTPLLGLYNLDNLMVAVGLSLGIGIEREAIEAAVPFARGAPGRLERVTPAGIAGPRVLVDYAHTPDAVARAIAAVRPGTTGRLVVVLGCGGDRDRTKRPLMGEVAARGADRFFATSDNPRTEDPERIVEDMLAGVDAAARDRVVRMPDRAEAIAAAIADAREDDLVLILGKGHEDYQILGTTKIRFDDREHATKALERRRGGTS
jgi:UDP-N-acetylmuramoyl-L-alanyl-D-glutamate--2,6-diaminopimelate ligase